MRNILKKNKDFEVKKSSVEDFVMSQAVFWVIGYAKDVLHELQNCLVYWHTICSGHVLTGVQMTYFEYK